ncbi:ATP-binding protein [Kiloniella laminariae]|uniref:histidine kinase n=1 Tax=Kiloniella laminariae TaxID=454162 RepID=A0ABT4LLC4_9PROT|nr:PAS domain-containing sensor histidine kinase [Kiloniella laminariae]MCZ4281882.1 ATP-binding protein [Kiloniella laminariae]
MQPTIKELLPHFQNWQDLSAFNRLSTPIWVFNMTDHNIWWGNEAALHFWEAETLADLVARDFSTDSIIVRTRLQEIFSHTSQGERVEEHWTLYPNGSPKMVVMTFTPVMVEDDKKAVLIEATLQSPDVLDHRAQRILEAVRYTPLMISTFAMDGRLLAQNPAAANVHDQGNNTQITLETRYNDPEILKRILGRYKNRKRFRTDLMVQTSLGERWHTLTAEIGLDPVSGGKVVVITEEDITQRVQAEEDLHRLNLDLEKRVTERTRKLSLAQQEAETANESKGNFLATMSHELRTPLNAIIGFTEMLRHQIYGPVNDRQVNALKDIDQSARHLLELINELLDASTIEQGELKLYEEQFDLDQLVNYCRATFEIETIKKDQTFKLNNAVSGLSMLGDARRFRQILTNLLANAVKYTPEGGDISLVIARDKHLKLVFTVSDNGIGIPENRLHDVCKAFTQAASSSWAAGKGVGLGLYITSQLVAAHGGELKISSKEGKGTKVSVIVPREKILD